MPCSMHIHGDYFPTFAPKNVIHLHKQIIENLEHGPSSHLSKHLLLRHSLWPTGRCELPNCLDAQWSAPAIVPETVGVIMVGVATQRKIKSIQHFLLVISRIMLDTQLWSYPASRKISSSIGHPVSNWIHHQFSSEIPPCHFRLVDIWQSSWHHQSRGHAMGHPGQALGHRLAHATGAFQLPGWREPHPAAGMEDLIRGALKASNVAIPMAATIMSLYLAGRGRRPYYIHHYTSICHIMPCHTVSAGPSLSMPLQLLNPGTPVAHALALARCHSLGKFSIVWGKIPSR